MNKDNELKNLIDLIPKGYKPDTKAIGALLKIKPKRLARLLNGTAQKVRLDELKKIADFFSIPIKDLIN